MCVISWPYCQLTVHINAKIAQLKLKGVSGSVNKHKPEMFYYFCSTLLIKLKFFSPASAIKGGIINTMIPETINCMVNELY